jgi:hypothetical protein
MVDVEEWQHLSQATPSSNKGALQKGCTSANAGLTLYNTLLQQHTSDLPFAGQQEPRADETCCSQ